MLLVFSETVAGKWRGNVLFAAVKSRADVGVGVPRPVQCLQQAAAHPVHPILHLLEKELEIDVPQVLLPRVWDNSGPGGPAAGAGGREAVSQPKV